MLKITPIDFDFGIGDIIPATQEAYSGGEFAGAIRKPVLCFRIGISAS